MEWIKQLIRLIIALFLQVLLIDRLQWLGICHPQIYIICLIMMPIRLPRWADILMGAFVGLIVDICSNTIGIHMAASVAVMYFRRLMINSLIAEPERIAGEITSASIGTISMWKLMTSMTAVHVLMVTMLSAWSFHHFLWTFLSIIVSYILTIILIGGYDMIHSRP